MKPIFFSITFVLCGLVSLPTFAQLKKESQVRSATIENAPTKDNDAATQSKDEIGTQTKDESVKPTKGNSTTVLQGKPKSKPKQLGTVKPPKDNPKGQTSNDVLQPKPKPQTGTVSNGNVGTNPRSNSGNNGVILVPTNNDPKNQPKPTTQEVEDNDEGHGSGGKSKCGVPGCTHPGRHEGLHKHEGHHHGEGEEHNDDDHESKGKGKGKGKNKNDD